MMELSVIFPVHNEAHGIAAFLEHVSNVMKPFSYPYEILCVENGSTDDSLYILQSLQKRYRNLRVIQSLQGWGNAVRAGVDSARGRYVCYMVSDGQVDPKNIITLYNLYKDNHVTLVKVWRTARENTTRLVNSRLYNTLAWFIFNLASRDINATPKLIQTKLMKDLNLTSHNIAIDLELLLKLKERGLQWIEIPVLSKKRENGTSTTNFVAVLEMVRAIIKFWLFRSHQLSLLVTNE